MSFSDLGLRPELLRAVQEKGYSAPTPIQAGTIPAILAGRDVLAGAQTGTGKTAAFVLPILQRLTQDAAHGTHAAPRALVLTPTRELAAQIADNATGYGRYLKLRSAVVFGGVGINPQIDQLRRGCDLLIATPGRLLDLCEQGALNLSRISCFVLDEADRMLDMGFIPAIRRVLKLLPAQRQNLMFSATYTEDIRSLAQRFLHDPVNVEVTSRNATAERVTQSLYRVPKESKRHLLAHLIIEGNWQQVLVFTRTKHGANRLAKQLESAGINSAAIHGNKSQAARVRALADFKGLRVTALVATEVAARGLDIKELPHVVNYELPNVPEDYVHRIGRTARAGASGAAVSLVSPDEEPLLRDIERILKSPIQAAAVPQFPILNMPADPDRGPPREMHRDRAAGTGGNGNRSGRSGSRRPQQGQRPQKGQGRTPGGAARTAGPQDGQQRQSAHRHGESPGSRPAGAPRGDGGRGFGGERRGPRTQGAGGGRAESGWRRA
ncbi:MAG: DEAD/DEAH box helicase [Steroidobacteraceae bacterium]